MKKLLITTLIFTGLIFSNKAPDSVKVQAYKTNSKIIVDGKLNEAVWQNVPISDFTQKFPDEGKPISEETKVWVAYDDENIYLGGYFYDSKPEKIDTRLFRRDNIESSDWIWWSLDTFNDDKTAYFFAINAGGSIADGTMYNDSWIDDSWDGVWTAKSRVNADGWSVEIKIPFSQLRFKESDRMVWGVNFNRDIMRRNENSFFVMVPSKESGFVSHFADLVGLDGIKPKQRFEILPYVVQKAQYLIHDENDPFYKSQQYRTTLGADIKIGLGSNLNIDATINPDFGQVEVDPAVVNLSAFETYFDEKRPFFIEGQNIFRFGVGGSNNNWGFNFGNPNLFYSRRIGKRPFGETPDYDYINLPSETRIIGAAKISGKLDGNWEVGGLSAFTERTYATIRFNGEDSEHEVEPFSHFGVLRARKEFNDGRQGLGFMATSVNRELGNPILASNLTKNAFAYGVDGYTFLDEDKTYALNGYFTGSYVEGSKEALLGIQERPYRYFQRPDFGHNLYDSNMTSMSGFYTRLMLNKQDGNFYFNTAIGAISPGFENNDLGFQWMADRINGHLVLGYRWFKPDDIFRKKTIYFAHYQTYNFEGNNLSNGLMTFMNYQFLNYYSIFVQGGYNFESSTVTLTRGGPIAKNPKGYFYFINGSTDNRKEFVLSLEFSNDKNANDEYSYSIESSLEWKPNSQLSFSVGPEYNFSYGKRQWVGDFEDPLATNTYGTRYVFGDIDYSTLAASIRMDWMMTPQMSLQLYIQPLISVGNYSNFKELAASATNDYNIFTNVNYSAEDDAYTIDPDGLGQAPTFTFGNPNFNFKSLRGNLVFRWEVLPGSILYLVWAQDRQNFDYPGEFQFNRDFTDLLGAETNNIFLAKFSYWLDF